MLTQQELHDLVMSIESGGTLRKCEPRIFVKDGDGKIVSCNENASHFLGFSSPDSIAGLTFRELFDDVEANSAERLDADAFTNNSPILDVLEQFTTQGQWPSGRKSHWVRTYRIPMILPGKSAKVLLVAHKDVTKDASRAEYLRQSVPLAVKMQTGRRDLRRLTPGVDDRMQFRHNLDGLLTSVDERLASIMTGNSVLPAGARITDFLNEPFRSQVQLQQRNGFSSPTRGFVASLRTHDSAELWVRITSGREATLFDDAICGFVEILDDSVLDRIRIDRSIVGGSLTLFELDFFTKRVWFNRPIFDLESTRPTFDEFRTRIPQPHADYLAKAVRRVRDQASSEALDITFPFRTLSGIVYWLRASGTPTRTGLGESWLFSGALVDVTQAHTAEGEIQVLKSAMDALPDTYVFLKNAEGKFVYVNRSFAALFRRSQESFERLDDRDLGFGQDEIEHYRRWDEQVRTNGGTTPVICETVHIQHDGEQTTYKFETIKQKVVLDGREFVLGIASDVTNVMRQEKELREFFEALPVAVHIKDEAGKYELWNEEFLVKAGLAPGTDIRGKSCSEVFPKYASGIRQRDEEVRRHSGPITYDVWIEQNGNPRRRYQITKIARRNGGIIGVSRETTAEFKADEAEIARKMVLQRQKAMELLIRSLRHDLLANLLSVLSAGIASGQNKPETAPWNEWSDILGFVRTYIAQLEWWLPDGAAIKPVRESVQLKDVVDQVAVWCGFALETPVVENLIDPRFEMVADRSLLQLLLLNLIDNSKKMTPDDRILNPVRVTADVTSQTDGVQTVRLTVDDGGCCIPRKLDREKLGVELGLSANPLTRTTQGSGFGLYLCARIAEAHGGRMYSPADSKRGGTRIEFDFPVHFEEGEIVV